MSVDLSGRGGPEWTGASTRRGAKRLRGEPSSPGATWRLNGSASGTVGITAVTGRIRVWDRSDAKDLAVTVPAGTASATLADGSVVYSGLDAAAVTLSGRGFRMEVRATDVHGTFTQAPGDLARSYVRGSGTFTTGTATGVAPGRRGGVRVLLTPSAPAPRPAPATP